MSIKALVSGVFHAATKISLYTGGAWHEVLRIQAYKTDNAGLVGWREIYKKAGTSPPVIVAPSPPPPPPPPPVVLSVTTNPTSLDISVRNGHGNITVGGANALVSGGVGPYTFHWEIYDWTADSPPTISSPDSQATSFSQFMLTDDHESATARVTAVDSRGNFGTADIYLTWTTYTWSKYGDGF